MPARSSARSAMRVSNSAVVNAAASFMISMVMGAPFNEQ